ncbi:MAG: class A beta-lactamase-related serine hydrolase [Muribaculaceae bacterium]|nr:class A beta-lactamase-related serine hydrolase [Muribaculaceae bacterium]
MKRFQLLILTLLMACGVHAEVGYAMIIEGGDTVTVNNEDKFPMMSVFKLHQAIALCNLFDRTGQSLDSIVEIPRSELNPQTWSPMLSDIPDSIISLPIRGLLNYALMLSDNNASNYLFNHIQSVKDADEYISTLIPRESFRMKFTEDEMFADHSLARGNHSSPLGAALLIEKLFTDSIISPDHAEFLRTTLGSCQTGTDRITAAFTDIPSVRIAHKTGSGFRDENGLLTAQNDVAFIELPDGRHVTIAIFVKDFNGDPQQASKLIESIALSLRRRAGI